MFLCFAVLSLFFLFSAKAALVVSIVSSKRPRRPSGTAQRAHPSRAVARERCTHLGSTKPPSAAGNSRTLRRDRLEKIFLFAPGAGQIEGIKQPRQSPTAARKPTKCRPGVGSRASLRQSGGTLVPPAPRLRPDLHRVAIPVGSFCFVGAFFFWTSPSRRNTVEGTE